MVRLYKSDCYQLNKRINMLTRIIFFASMLLVLYGCSGKKSKSLGLEERDEFTISYNSMDEAETKLLDVLESKYGHPEASSTTFRYLYYDELVDFVIKEPRTIEYEFAKLQSEGYADVVTSEDGNLRLYYWDNRSGGTWISWSNICQYRSGDNVYAYEGSIMDVKYGTQIEYNEGSNNCAILGIKTIYDKSSSPIYLVHAYIRESSNWGYASIEAIRIKNDELVAVPIFYGGIDACEVDSDTEEKTEQCYRGVEYTIADWYFTANQGEGWSWLFRYDDKANILYIPQADPEITDRYSLYRYNGVNLYYVGTDGGFWLHPTIRSFENLEVLFDTKDYRIRIDRMFDGAYRYTSWKNRKTMDGLPDAIIYGGVYDENKTEYRFRYNDYEYVVGTETGITIRYNGKEILSQEILDAE